MEKFNFKGLGVNYTILDQDTNMTEVIRVISSDELKNVIGEYINTDYTKVSPCIKEILKGFKGFARSPYHITWYATSETNHEVVLRSAISLARKEKNTIVITEILPKEELDTGFKRS